MFQDIMQNVKIIVLSNLQDQFWVISGPFCIKKPDYQLSQKQILLTVSTHIVQAVHLQKINKALNCKHHRRFIFVLFLGSIASRHLLVPNLCGGIKENLTSSWPTALMLEEELIQLTIHNFSKNEIIALVKNFMKYKLCCFLAELNQVYYEKFIGVVKFIPRACNSKK